MRDNLPATHGELFALPDHRILALEGPDAARFAHAQFMNDVAGLADGHWQWNGWLTPKGRVLALFALLRFDAQSLWLLLPDADPEDLRQSLQRFVFRSKVTLAARPDRQRELGEERLQITHVVGDRVLQELVGRLVEADHV